MENKQTAPKEIFIPSANIEAINARGQKCGMFYTDKKHDTEVKYLSETHVEELLSSKDKEIERLKLEIARLSENNAKQELNVYTQFIAGEDGMIQNLTFYDFINKGQIQHECKGSVKAGHTYQVIQEGDKLRLEDITPIENLLKNN